MRFLKGHGTGNDFVVLPDPDGALTLTADVVAALCDRRFGIGGDGVLRVVRSAAIGNSRASGASAIRQSPEWFMDYRNADGSLAEMCGNGARVFARFLVAEGLVAGPKLSFGTRAGVSEAVVEDPADGGEIALAMRRPRLLGRGSATLGPLTLTGEAVDVGNPHLVCRLAGGLRELAGLDLTTSPDVSDTEFPSGVNVEFYAPGVEVPGADLHVRMRVYERGSGETLSCGSGACAVAAVALTETGARTGRVAVDVPGGRLTVTLDGETCWLAGPAVIVATGTLDPAALDVRLPAAA
jgi:diaminopimelate epimerase